VGARAATGVAAALTVPAALALLVAGTDEQRRPRALGWWTAAGAGGGIAGLALGGVITDLAGWRAAFAAPAVLAFACLPFVTALDPGHAGDDRRPLDLRGTLAGVAGLVLLLAGLSAIGQGGAGLPAWAFLVAAAAALLAFARIEARAPFPLLPRGFLADRRLAAGTLASAVNTAATGPLAVLGAVYLQDVRGWSPAANGLSFVPFSAMVIVGSALGAALLGRLGAARTFALALVALVSMPLVSCAITADGGEVVLIAARSIDGLGLGCAAVTATALGTAGAAESARGFAAGLINTATQLGTALSIALLVPLAAAPYDAIAGLRLAFVGTAAIAAAGGTAVLVVLRRASRRPVGDERREVRRAICVAPRLHHVGEAAFEDGATRPRCRRSSTPRLGATPDSSAESGRSARRRHRTGARARSLHEPLGVEARADVDVELAQRAVAGVDERVPLAGGNDDHLPGADLAWLAILAEVEGRRALLRDDDLGIGVAVQRRPGAGRSLDEDRADAHAAVVGADELARDVARRQLVQPDDLDVGHGAKSDDFTRGSRASLTVFR
jgi:MFS family permease